MASRAGRPMKPILFEIGSFRLHSFGLLVALGFIAGSWIATRRAKAVGLDPDAVQDIVFPWLLVGGLLGARLWYVASYWERDFAGQPFTDVFAIWKGGMVFYGGLIGATFAGIVGVFRKKLPLWATADCLIPGVALGHVFGRLGCLLNGCCYGRVCEVPWALRFPKDHSTQGLPVHPAQLYEAALNLALCGFLVWWHAERRRFDGQIFAMYLIAYAFIRAFSEYFRGDYSVQSAPAAGIFTPGQTTSALILAAGIGLWVALRRRPMSKAA
jgi:phosphatidylglycerol---prolipoprotein diacylglyceryl transferase